MLSKKEQKVVKLMLEATNLGEKVQGIEPAYRIDAQLIEHKIKARVYAKVNQLHYARLVLYD